VHQVKIQAVLAPRLQKVSNSMTIHAKHCQLLGKPIHSASVANAVVRRLASHVEFVNALNAHKSRNRAVHDWTGYPDHGATPGKPPIDLLFVSDPWAAACSALPPPPCPSVGLAGGVALGATPLFATTRLCRSLANIFREAVADPEEHDCPDTSDSDPEMPGLIVLETKDVDQKINNDISVIDTQVGQVEGNIKRMGANDIKAVAFQIETTTEAMEKQKNSFAQAEMRMQRKTPRDQIDDGGNLEDGDQEMAVNQGDQSDFSLHQFQRLYDHCKAQAMELQARRELITTAPRAC